MLLVPARLLGQPSRGHVAVALKLQDVVVVRELPRGRGHTHVRHEQPVFWDALRQSDARALLPSAILALVHEHLHVAPRDLHLDKRAAVHVEVLPLLPEPHVRVTADDAVEHLFHIARAIVNDEPHVLVLVQVLRVLEGVNNDTNTNESRIVGVQVSGDVARLLRDPKRDAVAEELLAGARDAEAQHRAEARAADRRPRPEGALLRLPVRRKAHEVLVHRRVAVDPEVVADFARAIRLELLKRRGKADLLHEVRPRRRRQQRRGRDGRRRPTHCG
mmetsp:Transcript_37786/g.118311  ORF Transcript_37786/g.118311 Transcript_37786/m.118311 type:complete len:275 (-) Transcript_37786:160-984(-)